MTAARDLPFLADGGEMSRSVAAHDWSATPLGAITTWSPALCTATGIVLESRHPMLLWWGPGFTMIYNDAFMALAGDKHPSGLGARGDRMFADVWPIIGPTLRRVLSHGEASWVADQLLLMTRRGFPEETYWTYSFSPVRDADGAVLGVFTATNDTTARVVGERRLQTLTALGDVSAVSADSVDDAVSTAIDALAANPVDLPFAVVCLRSPTEDGLRVAASYGVPPDLPLDALVRDPDNAVGRALRRGEAVLSTGLQRRHPGVFRAHPTAPGDLGPDTAVVLPLSGTGGQPAPGAVVFGISPYRPLDDDFRSYLDLVAGHISAAITEAEAYAAERRRSAALAELDRAKTDFFTGVSHEFRTPLTLMLGPVDELRRDPALADPRTRETLDTVHRNGLRLGRLVDSLLDFSRLQAGHVQARQQPVDLGALSTDLAAAFRSAVLAAGLAYAVDCPDLGRVPVDPEMWEKIVGNLIGNALKYTLGGSITVRQYRDGRDAVLEVSDTGAGIPADQLEKVFDRFHRVAGTVARSHEGSGIGLALVRELVELHGGRVGVRSTPGTGSTFTVRVPLAGAHAVVPPADAVPASSGMAAFVAEASSWLPTPEQPPQPAAGGTTRTSGRVLIADDNADMRAYLRRLLGSEWEVDTVADGRTALERARARPPDLLVSDVMMPGLDGLALVARLRADPRTAQVPVLLLSARAGEEASVEGLAAGADDYLVKPFSAAELDARVRAHIRLGRRRRDATARAEDLAELSPALGWVSDATGRVGHVNASWLQFTGASAADELGFGWQARAHPDDLPEHLQRTATARAARRGWESEFRLRRADGRYRWLLEHAVPILESDTGTGVAGWVGSCIDITERHGRHDAALFQERERYRTLVAQAPVGIWSTDAGGATTFVNDQVARLLGRPAAEIVGSPWERNLHPEDRDEVIRSWTAAVRDGVPWEIDHRVVAADGEIRDVASSARPLRDAAGTVTGFLGTSVDVTVQRRAEQTRRAAAGEHAARQVSEAAAARLRAMVQGLGAIVWEADWDPGRDGLRFTFVSDRAEELLGHPARRWREDPEFWPTVIHPDDRAETLAFTALRTAAGIDHDLTYRAVAVDGRVVWLHQVVHVVPDGDRLRAQGLTVDVTEAKRAERSAALLAEAGRLMADGGHAQEQLQALVELLAREMGDGAVVSLVGPDGLLRRVAVATADPAVEEAMARIPPGRLPPSLAEALAAGRPVPVPITDDLLRAAAVDEADVPARRALGLSSMLLVPLATDDVLRGILAFASFGSPRHYDAADLGLAAELGRRTSLMLAADRQRTRERHMQQVSADLAAAGTVAEAARRLVTRLRAVLDAGAMSFYLVEPERGLRLVHAVGYPPEMLEAFASIRLDDPVPMAEVVRTAEPIWLRDLDAWHREWPHLAHHTVASGSSAAAALPLIAGGRVVGTVGISFGSAREFPADERAFVMALVTQSASAFERAATADVRRLIAETLQESLLPPALPELERLSSAARYLPGAHGTRAGGDWYDVTPLAGGRIAIAVGDVVGQGAGAAATMGQLRSVLSGYLLEGHPPVESLELLDRFATRVPGATGSTVVCLVLEPETGELTWASAGHLPPLVTGPTGSRFLDGAGGTVLGVHGRPPYTAGHARIAAGDSVVLYTDGLVERRNEVVDDGLDRLAAAAGRHHALAPFAMADALLVDGLADTPDAGHSDDIALIVARLVPAPLRLELPSLPSLLRRLRAEVQDWAAAVGLNEDDAYDLQLAVGEAAANAAEHAYRDGPAGTVRVELDHEADGTIRARIRDRGRWRPQPADRGFRGRGLDLIRDIGTGMRLEHGAAGTEVRFSLPSGRPPAAGSPAGAAGTGQRPGPAVLRAGRRSGDGLRVRIEGDLDLAGVEAVRPALLAAARDAGPLLTADLRATAYLASAGVALLVEADRIARGTGGRLRLLVPANGIVRRALVRSGVHGVLEIDVTEQG